MSGMAPRANAASEPADDPRVDPAAGAADETPRASAHDDLGRGVEHLQSAAHEMLAAARSFLDVVEDVVSDRDKLSGVAATFTDLLGAAGGSLARVADRVAGTGHSEADEAPDPATRPRVRRIQVD